VHGVSNLWKIKNVKYDLGNWVLVGGIISSAVSLRVFVRFRNFLVMFAGLIVYYWNIMTRAVLLVYLACDIGNSDQKWADLQFLLGGKFSDERKSRECSPIVLLCSRASRICKKYVYRIRMEWDTSHEKVPSEWPTCYVCIICIATQGIQIAPIAPYVPNTWPHGLVKAS